MCRFLFGATVLGLFLHGTSARAQQIVLQPRVVPQRAITDPVPVVPPPRILSPRPVVPTAPKLEDGTAGGTKDSPRAPKTSAAALPAFEVRGWRRWPCEYGKVM